MKTIPTEKEIDEVLNRAAEAEDTGESRWPGMIYEQGVQAGIEWVLGRSKNNPMDE